MSNPLFNQFGTSTNRYSEIIQQAKQMENRIKDPRKEVETLLQSGQMSQQQFNQFAKKANEIIRFM